MCISAEMFEQYSNRIESLVSEVRIDVMELKTDVAAVKKDVAEVKNDTKDLSRDIADVKKDTLKTEKHLEHINGKVGRHDRQIHDIEVARSPDYRVVGCPQNEAIRELSNSLMSASVLREYLKQEEIKRDKKYGRWIAFATALMTGLTVLAMILVA